MENMHGLMRHGSDSWSSLNDGDFDEEDVWSTLSERKDSTPKSSQPNESSPISSRTNKFQVPSSASRLIPKSKANGNGKTSSGFVVQGENKGAVRIRQQSAPVNIPDWSKIYGNMSKVKDRDGFDENRDDDDDLDDDDYKLPPHEFIANRLARSQISSFSVVEGVGRTLKGRDLSKMRNAILTKTGFLEQ